MQQTALAPAHDAYDEHGTATGVTNAKLAMWVFLSSEFLLFGSFISAYLLYKGRSHTGPKPSQVYDIPFTSTTSFILLMSSLTMVLALAAIQRGDNRRFRRPRSSASPSSVARSTSSPTSTVNTTSR
jgi:cytochrome c oxidase subunit 3/cytochrome o ubiquinol oxidase subunit 3